MKIKSAGLFIIFSLLICCFPLRDVSKIRFPYQWIETSGYNGNIDSHGCIEPSGICIHPTRNTLFIVSDEGIVYELTMEGTLVSENRVPGDLEGITVNPQTGLLYIAVEGVDTILEYDPVKGKVSRRFPINREFQGNENYLESHGEPYEDGIESIVFISDDKHAEGGSFYVGNQWDPACIMEVLVPLRTQYTETSEARIIRIVYSKLDDPSAMYYDENTQLLNVVSDADNILIELTLKGKLMKAYAFPGQTQEGLIRDEDGFLYIAQDLGGIIKIKDLR